MENEWASISDEWGGIDKKVQGIVTILNRLGFKTTGSCEGHIDRDSPAPWIAIKTTKRKMLRDKMEALLREFYRERDVSEDTRLVLMESNVGFWLHDGGAAYDKWRAEVEKNAKQISKGEKGVLRQLNDEEKKTRTENLAVYHKEIEEFAKFLEGLL